MNHRAVVDNIERLIETKQFDNAQSASIELLDDCIAGLRYYQTYDWLFLRSIVAAGYIGWIVYSLIFVLKEYSNVHYDFNQPYSDADWMLTGFTLLLSVILVLVLGYKDSPILYYAYISFPLYFWWYTLSLRNFLRAIVRSVAHDPQWITGIGYTLAYVFVLEVLASLEFTNVIGCELLLSRSANAIFTSNCNRLAGLRNATRICLSKLYSCLQLDILCIMYQLVYPTPGGKE